MKNDTSHMEHSQRGGGDVVEKLELGEMITIRASKKQELRLYWSDFSGSWRLNLRTWYVDPESGEWRPTKRGVSLSHRDLAMVLESLDRLESPGRLTIRPQDSES